MASVFVAFEPFSEEGADPDQCPSEFLQGIWTDRQKLIDRLVEIASKRGNFPAKCYQNVIYQAHEYEGDETDIIAVGDLVDGYSPGIKKRVGCHLHTFFVIREIQLDKSIEE